MSVMKRLSRFEFLFIATLIFAALPGLVQARSFDGGSYRSQRLDRDSGDDNDLLHNLSVGGGVAAPSETAFSGENAAGLIYNRRPSVLAFLAAGPLYPNLLSNGLGFLAGNGMAAVSLGVQTYNNAQDQSGNISTFNFGVATYSSFINMSFGLNGVYRFQNSSAPSLAASQEPTWTADLGMLYNPFGNFRLGLNLYGLSKGVTAGAVGFAANVNPFSLVSLDVSTNNQGRGLTFKPGIGVRASSFNLAYSYGMQLDKSADSGITAGNTIGLGYEFNPTFRLQGYYNSFVPYYLGATVSF